MTPLEKFREVVAATRASGGEYVVRTLAEAEALLECVDSPDAERWRAHVLECYAESCDDAGNAPCTFSAFVVSMNAAADKGRGAL